MAMLKVMGRKTEMGMRLGLGMAMVTQRETGMKTEMRMQMEKRTGKLIKAT